MFIDFNNRRALTVGDGNTPITLTTVNDVASVVAEAIEYCGEWPVIGGISGFQTTVSGLIQLGEKLRGTSTQLLIPVFFQPSYFFYARRGSFLTRLLGDFVVDTLSMEDLEGGELKSSWHPLIDHKSLSDDIRHQVSKGATIEFVRTSAMGTWRVSDEWNKLLPAYRFTTAEEYLTKVWEGKP